MNRQSSLCTCVCTYGWPHHEPTSFQTRHLERRVPSGTNRQFQVHKRSRGLHADHRVSAVRHASRCLQTLVFLQDASCQARFAQKRFNSTSTHLPEQTRDKKKKNQRARSVFLFPSFVSVVCAAPIFPFPSRASPLCFQERLCLLDIPSSASPVRLCTPSPESHVEKTLVLAKPQRAHIGGRNGCRNARYPSSD